MPAPAEYFSTLPWGEYVARVSTSDDFAAVLEHFVPLPVEFRRFDQEKTRAASLTLESVVTVSRTVVLLGAPGAGKTTAVRALFLSRAESGPEGIIPLYVKFSDWASYTISEDAPWQKEFINAIASTIRVPLLGSQTSIDLPTSLLHDFAVLPFLIIFDGLDEVRDSAVRLHLAKCIARFAAEYQHLQLLVTARKYSFTEEFANALPFEVIEFARLGDDHKARVIERYVPPGSSVRALLMTLRSDLRLTRLTDIPMLLRIFAENGGVTTARSRGALFRLHVQTRVAQWFPEGARSSIHDLLTNVAEQIRERYPSDLHMIDSAASDDYPDVALLVRRVAEGLKNTSGELASDSLLDRLLRTRLVEVRDRSAGRSIAFSLPQYEDYYLARKIAVDLDDRLKPTAASPIRESPYISNREWHDVVVFAAGLLERSAVERLVTTLKGDSYLFLRGWVLGEVHAPHAEKLFVRECSDRVSEALTVILAWLSICCLGTLALWAFSLVPFTFLYNHLWSWKWWVAAITFVSYVAGVPLAVRWLYGAFLYYYCDKLQRRLPIEMTALSCLQSAAVDLALREVALLIASKYSQPAASYDYSAFDPVYHIVNFAQIQIQRCRDLVSSDAESILAQIDEDPDLIDHYIRLPAQGFSTKDFEIVSRYITNHTGEVAIKFKLLQKLGDVATQSQEMRRCIEEFVVTILDSSETDQALRQKARTILNRLSERPRSVIFIVADLRGILRNNLLRRFLAFVSINVIGMAAVSRFADGKTLFEKLKNAWPFYAAWFVLLVIVGRVYLPRGIWSRLLNLRGMARTKPHPRSED